MLIEQLATRLQRDDLATQPTEHTPNGRMLERAFVDGLCCAGHFVAKAHSARPHGLAVGLTVAVEILLGELERTWSGVPFIGENESRVVGKYKSTLAATPSREQDQDTAYLLLDDQSQTTLPNIVWRERPRRLAASAV